jgi:hypothetical protein
MGIFRDGKDRDGHGGISEDTIRRVIEQSGSDLTDKLGKMLANIPQNQIVQILNGEKIDKNDLEDAESLKKLAKQMGSSQKQEASNFQNLGQEQKVKIDENVDETIRLLEEMGDE